MGFIWFWLVAVMIVGYVVLDGFDIGVGVLHLFLPRDDAERQASLRSIGPVWDGNEVWLLAGGGTLYFAFPLLYASAFSGFYLPLMIVLWLLIGRGISLELSNHLEMGVWHTLLDRLFGISSALLAIFFGAALANVIRGVPLQADGFFFLPLWTNWRPGPNPGILDWNTDRWAGRLSRTHAARSPVADDQSVASIGTARPPYRAPAVAHARRSHRREPHRHHRRAAADA
jgi:cytochrome d ubiquinol oxidase subunit II